MPINPALKHKLYHTHKDPGEDENPYGEEKSDVLA